MDDLQISPDSKHILVQRNGRVLVLDAFNGARKYELGQGDVTASCFSPCGHYVYAGSTNGQIFVWKTHHGDEVARHIGRCPFRRSPPPPPPACVCSVRSPRGCRSRLAAFTSALILSVGSVIKLAHGLLVPPLWLTSELAAHTGDLSTVALQSTADRYRPLGSTLNS